MPHDEYPDEVEDRARVINELRGVIRRQLLAVNHQPADNYLPARQVVGE